jgi:hypothetical protein
MNFNAPNIRRHIMSALLFAIAEQRKYERQILHYTVDSGQVGAWQQIYDDMKKEDGQ